MPTIVSPLPFTFSNGTVIDATQVNANEGQIVANVNVLGTTSGAALVGTAAATNNAGSTVQAQLTNVGGPTGATNVGFTPLGTGAVATTVGAKLSQYLSVADFGVSGTGTERKGQERKGKRTKASRRARRGPNSRLHEGRVSPS